MARILPLLEPHVPVPGLPDKTIGDFWSWAFSDVTMNTTRAIYTEWLVALALGLTGIPRDEWADQDLIYRDTKIEVKSSAFLQSWEQKKASAIRFDIKSRAAQIHVFCVQTDTELTKADMLNPVRWRFYVVPTRLLPSQKSVGLSRLKDLCGKAALSQPEVYDRLRVAIDSACEWLRLWDKPMPENPSEH